MANTDKGEYTRIPNKILEALYSEDIRFTSRQFKVLLFIIRRTYGWNKYAEYISLSSMAKAINVKRPNVCNAVSDLRKMGVLNVEKTVGKKSYISINDPEKWDKGIS